MRTTNNAGRVNTRGNRAAQSETRKAMSLYEAYALINAKCDDDDIIDIDERKNGNIWISASESAKNPASATFSIRNAVSTIMGGPASECWNKAKSRYEISGVAWQKAAAAKKPRNASAPAVNPSTENKPRTTRSASIALSAPTDKLLSSATILSAFDKFVEAQQKACDAFKKALLDAGTKPRTAANAGASRSRRSRLAK